MPISAHTSTSYRLQRQSSPLDPRRLSKSSNTTNPDYSSLGHCSVPESDVSQIQCQTPGDRWKVSFSKATWIPKRRSRGFKIGKLRKFVLLRQPTDVSGMYCSTIQCLVKGACIAFAQCEGKLAWFFENLLLKFLTQFLCAILFCFSLWNEWHIFSVDTPAIIYPFGEWGLSFLCFCLFSFHSSFFFFWKHFRNLKLKQLNHSESHCFILYLLCLITMLLSFPLRNRYLLYLV